MFNIFIAGFVLQASLILALGAQNLFVLECGIKKRFPYRVALVCSLCDFILVMLGVLGAGTIFISQPVLKISLGFFGVVFLIYYGLQKVLEGFGRKANPENSDHLNDQLANPKPWKSTLLMTLSFSLLNPHVYLDTIVLIGGFSTKYAFLQERFVFGFGAAGFSTLWFLCLSFFSLKIGRLFSSEKFNRRLNLFSGILLLWFSYKLGSEVYGWAAKLL